MKIFHTAIEEQFPGSPPAERGGPPGLREVPGGPALLGTRGRCLWPLQVGAREAEVPVLGGQVPGVSGQNLTAGASGKVQDKTGLARTEKGAVRSRCAVNQNPFLFSGAGNRNPVLIWMLDRFWGASLF